jgi:Protein of unknown function (DUF3253)
MRDSPVTEAPTLIEDAILSVLAKHEPGKTVTPEEAAREAAGAEWHAQLGAVRRAAVKLALTGRLVIYRKGKPVDPADFKGVYRLGLPRHD